MSEDQQSNVFGPLTNLIGTWQGNKGVDMAPEKDGLDENGYYETIEFVPVDDEIENAEEQELVAVHHAARRRSEKLSCVRPISVSAGRLASLPRCWIA